MTPRAPRAPLFLALFFALFSSPLQAALVTIAWDPSPDPVTGYLLLAWRGPAVVPMVTDLGLVTQTTIDAADRVAVVAYRSGLVCQPQPDPAPVTCVPGLSQLLYFVSYPSPRLAAGASPTDPACAPPLGPEAIALVVTGWVPTTGRPGSSMYLQGRIDSRSTITRAVVRINGQDVLPTITSGTSVGRWWFPTPPSGTYSLSLYAENGYGCQREVLASRPLVVP